MYQTEYRKKLLTPEQAAARVTDANTLLHGMANAEPPALLGSVAVNDYTSTAARQARCLIVEHDAFMSCGGKSTSERALAIIELAHPHFRDDLLRAAERAHLL